MSIIKINGIEESKRDPTKLLSVDQVRPNKKVSSLSPLRITDKTKRMSSPMRGLKGAVLKADQI